MNVLIVAPAYPPGLYGGGGRVESNISRCLKMKENRVVVISSAFEASFMKAIKDGMKMEVVEGIPVLRLPLLPAPSKYPTLDIYMPPSLKSVIALTIFLIKKRKTFDVIHIHDFGEPLVTYTALLITIVKGPPYILTIHGIPKVPYSSFLRFLSNLYSNTIGKVVINKSQVVTTTSHAVADEIKTRFGKSIENKLAVIPNGIQLDEINVKNLNYEILKKRIKQKLNIPEECLVILSLGRLTPQKGFDTLLKALRIVSNKIGDLKLVIAGKTTAYLDYLKKITKEEAIEGKVEFIGFISEKLKYELLRSADIFVIPSLWEPFGIVALEAMAVGAPIVASRIGGLKEVLTHGKTALLVTPGDEIELANAIIRLVNDQKLRIRLSKAAMKDVVRYDWKNIINAYIEVYRQVAPRSHVRNF